MKKLFFFLSCMLYADVPKTPPIGTALPGTVIEQTIGGDDGGDFIDPNLQNRDIVGVADFDDDGDVDVIRFSPSLQKLEIFRNDGKGNFTAGQKLPSLIPKYLRKAGMKMFDVLFADFNADGRMDLLLGVSMTAKSGRVFSTHVIAKNTGNARFRTSPLNKSSLGKHDVNQVIQFADWDDDGDLDVFYAGHWRMNRKGVLVNRERSFHSLVQVPDALGSPTTLVSNYRFGDLNGDGLLDCLSGMVEYVSPQSLDEPLGSTNMRLYFGLSKSDERMPWSDFVTLPINQFFTDALGNPTTGYGHALFDVDLDGDLDVLVHTSDGADEIGNPGYHTKVLLNQGRINQDPSNWPSLRLESTEVMRQFVTDYNGDGIIDLCGLDSFLSPSASGPILHEGHGFLGDLNLYSVTILAMTDIDVDRDADILYRNSNDGSLYWVKNPIR